ncbi:hypothetical protein ETAA8_13770 [Anatilimnocola aggregata]|uniref:Uncharacterized protein n=1 Tax=Anatilimnocola aggregata TaxID=2528021 RepID=A0A517Y7T1_9BACT|nr:hypothetical protein [Anatilimnocola aggregata]QDU26299.1 hypothetical protein ETAA8_13770 [Anatilimnocola aggregata]
MFGNVWLELGLIGLGLAAIVGLVAWKWLQRREVKVDLPQARRQFQLRREWLEAHFLTIASQSGKPRGLHWADCDFDDAVSFARDRNTGRLRAFVGVTISFEAIEGGGMEDNPNVHNRRAATAVFNLNGEAWSTDGRAIFNLNPEQAIEHFRQELEHVE